MNPLTALLLLTLGMASACSIAAPAIPPTQPNIVVILSDDMGYSDLGCYGGEIQTPNLDQLAANGLRFTQFYNTARCCPTRASLLTGLYPHQAGVGHMTTDSQVEGFRGELNRQCVTIAEALKPAGYRTYGIGKWHVARDVKPEGPKYNWPLQRGFDRHYGTITGGGSYYDPSGLVRDNTMITAVSDPEYPGSSGSDSGSGSGSDFYYTDALSHHAAKFVTDHARDHAGKPFFMYVAYTAAHWPLHAKPTDIAKYRGKYDAGYQAIRQARFARQKQLGVIAPDAELSPQAEDWNAVTNKDWEARCMEVYAAQVDCMDQGVGKIVQALKTSGQWDNTLIFYLQDNGACAENTGRQGHETRAAQPTLPTLSPDYQQQGSRPKQTRDGWPVLTGTGVMPGPRDTFIAYGRGWANVGNTPFREYKHWVHEGGISTPLIAHWPARIKDAGKLRSQPGHLVDIMATCLDVAGATYPTQFAGQPIKPLEGKTLLPALDGKPPQRDPIYWEHEGNRAVREGDWKLVAKGPAGPWELYNIKQDRSELHDLTAKEPQRAAQLQAKWEAYAKRANVLPWIWKPAYGSTPTASTDPAKRPNIILMLSDDLGLGDLGCYGGQIVPTPRLDRMAAEGTRFTQYYCPAPICSPSRAGLLTGNYPGRCRITSYLQTRAGNAACEQADFLETSATSLPRRLKTVGYTTAHFGKWHLGGGRDVTNAPAFHAYGYDEHASTWESPEPHPDITATNWIWSAADKIKRWDRSAFFVDKTLDFLRTHTNQPCFVNLWFDDPHTPWVPHAEAAKAENKPNLHGVMTELDRQVGRLLDGLRASGLEQNTLVIFTSDNGPLPTFDGDRTAGLRGSKLSLYEGGIRLPFIVRWPGHVPAGRVDSQTVLSGLDIFPTLCSIGAVDLPPGRKFPGENFSQAFLGQDRPRKTALLWEYGRNDQAFAYPKIARDRSPQLAIREADWKLLVNLDGTHCELYNLAVDPTETNNLAQANPDLATRLCTHLLTWRQTLK